MAKKKKNGITTRGASDQCKTSDRGCYAMKRFSTKERTMLSFEQCGSFKIKKMFGDQGVERKRILPKHPVSKRHVIKFSQLFIPHLSHSNL